MTIEDLVIGVVLTIAFFITVYYGCMGACVKCMDGDMDPVPQVTIEKNLIKYGLVDEDEEE